MQKILLAILASAVAVTMLSAFGPLAALANPSPGVPGGGAPNPTPQLGTGGAHPGVPGVAGCGNPGGGTAPGNSGSQGAHAPGQGYNQGSPGQPDGSQYDVSCYQQSQHNP